MDGVRLGCVDLNALTYGGWGIGGGDEDAGLGAVEDARALAGGDAVGDHRGWDGGLGVGDACVYEEGAEAVEGFGLALANGLAGAAAEVGEVFEGPAAGGADAAGAEDGERGIYALGGAEVAEGVAD